MLEYLNVMLHPPVHCEGKFERQSRKLTKQALFAWHLCVYVQAPHPLNGAPMGTCWVPLWLVWIWISVLKKVPFFFFFSKTHTFVNEVVMTTSSHTVKSVFICIKCLMLINILLIYSHHLGVTAIWNKLLLMWCEYGIRVHFAHYITIYYISLYI